MQRTGKQLTCQWPIGRRPRCAIAYASRYVTQDSSPEASFFSRTSLIDAHSVAEKLRSAARFCARSEVSLMRAGETRSAASGNFFLVAFPEGAIRSSRGARGEV